MSRMYKQRAKQIAIPKLTVIISSSWGLCMACGSFVYCEGALYNVKAHHVWLKGLGVMIMLMAIAMTLVIS